MIREVILTTVSSAGEAHIAPLGLVQAHESDNRHWIIAPFAPSRTLDNIAVSRIAIANYTDDPLIFAGCLTGRKDWPLTSVPGVAVPRLSAALAHDVLQVEAVEDHAQRPRFTCVIVQSATHAPFTGMNRARSAILELAILVSRLHILPKQKVQAEIAYLSIGLEKTAGPNEQLAWQWLMERVNAFYGTDGLK
ncbi:DUF447 family protein [Aureimonas fodinaquatilis]|uniref:DUF447 family protein n=1 Tax=Aureimonas fodinaquatilis TaxID=2565783 RepID=A0A5B0DRI3_9HYPH|nr:DUF447 domain-containing protein [Aureimonas fodinaquatilis]KAA0968612.1 DUF447 family protein [Aureimonas fodinaquatilis]